MKMLLTAAALGTLAIAGAALAQTTATTPAPTVRPMPTGGMPHGGRGMMRADTDHDGVVTRAEAIAEATRRFDRLDVNHDGKLDASEMPQRPVPTPIPGQTPPPPPGSDQ